MPGLEQKTHHLPGGVASGERREDMYRQYENPRTLENELKILKEDYKKAIEEDTDLETLFGIHESISELEERINFGSVK